MATLTCNDENLAETDEVSYENAGMIDNEPFYRNFAAIQNDLRHYDNQKQLNTSYHLINKRNHIDRIETESSPSDDQHPSRTTGGYTSHLTHIVEDSRHEPTSSYMQSSTDNNPSLNSTCNSGGVHNPFVNNQYADTQYFRRWYIDRYQRSASMTSYYPVNHVDQQTTQKPDDYQSDINIQPPVATNAPVERMDEKHFQNKVHRMYGFDDVETISSVSSRRSSINENKSPAFSDRSSTPVPLHTIDHSKPKQITIREYFPCRDAKSLMVNGSISPSSQQTVDEICYDQVVHNHPEICQDPDPEIITKSNPDQVIYKQNVTIRYLAPPTPPPPGPLIIREVLPPRQPSPPPLIIKHQQPTPPTPPPLILREIPPPPPLVHQEAKIITKIVPQEFAPSQRVIMEHKPALPQKPQSIIIEKWLPYKPTPPREVIYERLVEPPPLSEFQPPTIPTIPRRRTSKSIPRLPIPVHIEQRSSFDYLDRKLPTSAFDHLAYATQQQLEVMQHRVAKQIRAQQRWLAKQQQQQHQMNMYMQMPFQLATPALVINHPPTTRTTNVFAQREAFQQQQMFYPQPFMYPSYI